MEKEWLDAVVASPADDAPRLQYAAWLDQHAGGIAGRAPDEMHARADFIRLQIELERFPEGDAERTSRERRARELLARHQQDWEADLAARGVESVTFRRGFPDRVDLFASDFVKHAAELFGAAPITRAAIGVVNGPDEWHELLNCPKLRHLSSLSLYGSRLGNSGAQAVAECPHLAKLSSLYLESAGIGTAGVRSLAAAPALRSLRHLSLAGNRIGVAGALAIAESEELTPAAKASALASAGFERLARQFQRPERAHDSSPAWDR
jgi:uncharacterized protein (TIGR02996 family)